MPKLDDQAIVLTEADFASDEAFVPALAWDRWPVGKVEVRVGDTSGLMSGRVTILAGTLRRIAGPLVPVQVPDDFQLPISLKTVVLQIQPFLQRSNEENVRVAAPDFDTPIAQVAREDEGFFKLEKSGQTEKAGPPPDAPPGSQDALPPAVPAFSLIREKPAPPSAEPAVPSLPVTVGRPAGRSGQTDERSRHEQWFDPFASLPPVGPRPLAGPASPAVDPSRSMPKEVPGTGQGAVGSQPDPPRVTGLAQKPARRAAVERLQAIFMTDDLLDFAQVLRLVSQFPRVRLAFAVGRDGMVYGEAPAALGQYAALAIGIVDAARRFARLAAAAEGQGITILGEAPVSIIGNESLSLVLLHEGRNLPPGMKERVTEIAQALSELLPAAADETRGSA
ncbi:MAG: hypothetical protein JO069_13560 [Verrucomicrobia bacterium]|nr:hypothetical protein [Verrucomicrobiota bacterium]